MSSFFYTNEKNVQIVIALLKAHGIKKVVASPGSTNIPLVRSLQHDGAFEIYSAPDERSAAYIACGLAAESGAPVVLSCTGATASRNYIPGLTEAYYRKLPVLAVTSALHAGCIGNGMPQVIDRSQPLNDMVKISVHLATIHDHNDEWSCTVQANKAILELFRHGGGPAHINLVTTYSRDYSIQELPPVRVIRRYGIGDGLPTLPKQKIAVFVGAHLPWTAGQTEALDTFCETHDAVVFCDWTSNYHGKFRCDFSLVLGQGCFYNEELLPELVIHIGEISGAYELGKVNQQAEVWRVNPDGEVRDTFRMLTNVFEMGEEYFFRKYAESAGLPGGNYAARCNALDGSLLEKFRASPELPFSNLWIASEMAPRLPGKSVLHLGILNSLRSWNLIARPGETDGFSNTGGFGIDGCLSTLLGGSLARPDVLHFCIVGDLAFFYDMNALGNRHIGKNIRILLINNGNGTEFRHYNHPGSLFGEESGAFISAEGHYGRKSPVLVKHYAEDLGFEYLHAADKSSFLTALERFVAPSGQSAPMLLEVFTESASESEALYAVLHLIEAKSDVAHLIARKVLPDNLKQGLKNLLRGHK